MEKHEIEVAITTLVDLLKVGVDEVLNIVASPLVAAKNALNTIYGGAKEYCFNTFLNYFYEKLKADNLSEKDIAKFNKKLSSKKSRLYLSNILDSLYFSKSLTTVKILALITLKYAHNDDFDYCDLILISALKDIYDEDILKIDYFYNQPSSDNLVTLKLYKMEERVSLEKLQNLNIFGRDRITGRLTDAQNKPLYYEKTGVSMRFMEYYNEIRSTYRNKLN